MVCGLNTCDLDHGSMKHALLAPRIHLFASADEFTVREEDGTVLHQARTSRFLEYWFHPWTTGYSPIRDGGNLAIIYDRGRQYLQICTSDTVRDVTVMVACLLAAKEMSGGKTCSVLYGDVPMNTSYHFTGET